MNEDQSKKSAKRCIVGGVICLLIVPAFLFLPSSVAAGLAVNLLFLGVVLVIFGIAILVRRSKPERNPDDICKTTTISAGQVGMMTAATGPVPRKISCEFALGAEINVEAKDVRDLVERAGNQMFDLLAAYSDEDTCVVQTIGSGGRTTVGKVFDTCGLEFHPDKKIELYAWIRIRFQGSKASWVVMCAEKGGASWRAAEDSHFTVEETDARVVHLPHYSLQAHRKLQLLGTFAVAAVPAMKDFKPNMELRFSRDVVLAARSLATAVWSAFGEALESTPTVADRSSPPSAEGFIRDE